MAFQLEKSLGKGIVALGANIGGKPQLQVLISKDLVSERSELNAGTFIREMAKHIRGGGGGQPFYASAGGSNPDGLDQAVQTIKELI